MDLIQILQNVAVMGLPILTAITLHEVAHGWAARSCGDRTAEAQGRLSLNPINHVDPVGTVILPGLLLLSGAPFLFGWAKPVPVDPSRFKHYRADWVKVAAAGPAAERKGCAAARAGAAIISSIGGDKPVSRPGSLMQRKHPGDAAPLHAK